MKTVFFLLLFFPNLIFADIIKVAVIDTGLSKNHKVKLCNTGHKDFTGEGLIDRHGHGTNISHLIEKHSNKINYCQIIIKIFRGYSAYYETHNSTLARAIDYAINQNVDIINISAGGFGYDIREDGRISAALNKGITVIISAGNSGLNLDQNCIYYPACYDNRSIVVGNVNSQSNTGMIVDLIVDGNNKTAGGYTMSGTSQSSAIVTGRMAEKKYYQRNINSKEKKAVETAIKAYLKQSGIEKDVDKFIQKTRKIYLTKDINYMIDKAFPIFQALVEKRIEWNYEF